MTLSPRLFACAFALLALPAAGANADPVPVKPSSPPPAPTAGNAAAPAAEDTPSVAAVRQFLAAHAAGDTKGAYALLSAESQKVISPQVFAVEDPPPPFTPVEMSQPIYGLGLLLNDPKNEYHYTYTVLGPDPKNPTVVLVRAVPPASLAGVTASTLRLVTVTDPGGDSIARNVRLDARETLAANLPGSPPHRPADAGRVQSQSNLKLIGLGILQYTQDHDEHVPDAAHWIDEIMPYVKDKAVFHDPAASAGQAYTYAYNRALSHQSLAQFDAPAQTVMVFESTKGVKNASDTGQSVPHPGRYSGGTDYLFADGHAKWLPDGTKPSFKLTGK